MKKLLSGALAACLLCGMLAGCGGAKDDAPAADAEVVDTADANKPLTAEMILAKLKEAGVLISNEIVYDNSTDPNGSGAHDYIEKANFSDESLKDGGSTNEPLGGTLEIFANTQAAASRAESLRGESATFKVYGYQILGANFLLRLNAQFSNEDAQKYAEAINGTIIKTPNDEEQKLAKDMAEGALDVSLDRPTEEMPKSDAKSVPETETKAPVVTETTGQKNARASAADYLDYTSFSYSGLIGQLEYEGYSNEEATYAVDKCGADWKEQAAKKAQEYIDYTSFSRSGLIDQLKFEGFTQEQAEYGATAVGY